MNRIIEHRVLTLILILTVLVEGVLLGVKLLPGGPPGSGKPGSGTDTTGFGGDAPVSDLESQPQRPDPVRLASGFFPGRTLSAHRSTRAAEHPVVRERAVEPDTLTGKATDGIVYVGSITEGNGELWYYFKDTRTSRVRKLFPGRSVSGWILTDVKDDRFILSADGEEFNVAR
jgi:hypothetical protein